ncbi:microcephalin-like [Limulus polyphemus]|uniref:Microcephalin-like n=1 Tax=Limulus polyphemus TaxID=6850 RepID=A0ABM1BCL3_LIMPO|nr:microcephalin-like [Limulus polyphemus]XP_022247068.1 microcephalin-like [Limulus polyphemus]
MSVLKVVKRNTRKQGSLPCNLANEIPVSPHLATTNLTSINNESVKGSKSLYKDNEESQLLTPESNYSKRTRRKTLNTRCDLVDQVNEDQLDICSSKFSRKSLGKVQTSKNRIPATRARKIPVETCDEKQLQPNDKDFKVPIRSEESDARTSEVRSSDQDLKSESSSLETGESVNNSALIKSSRNKTDQNFQSIALTPPNRSISINSTPVVNEQPTKISASSCVTFSPLTVDQEQSTCSQNQNINQQVTDIISVLEGEDQENLKLGERSMEQKNHKHLNEILKGVVACVEVRSGREDRSKAIEQQLQLMGAKVVPRLSRDVTHLVFKEGRVATRLKALAKGIHIVSVLWVDSCKQERVHTSEHLYPAHVPESYNSPVATKLRKPPYMQPKDFSTEFEGSAERLKQIFNRVRKNQQSENKQTEIGTDILVAKTPSPISLESTVQVESDCTSVITSNKTNVPFNQKLHEETTFHVKTLTPKTGKKLTAHASQSNAATQRKRKLFSCTKTNNQNDVVEAITPDTYTDIKTMENHTNEKTYSRKLTTAKAKNTQTLRKESQGQNIKKNHNAFDILKSSSSDSDVNKMTGVNTKRRRVNKLSLDILTTDSSFSSEKSVPSCLKNNCSEEASLASSRPSLEDFKVKKTGQKKRRKKNRNLKRNEDHIHISPSSDTSLLTSKTTDLVNRTLVMTSVKLSDQEAIYAIATKLGGFVIRSNVGEDTTHIICGESRRTINILFGLAQGCWILSPQWVFKSLEAGRWLEEEPFELSDYFPAVQISRLERAATGPGYRQDLFGSLGFIYISPYSSPPKEKLVQLVNLVGGTITPSYRHCQFAVGPLKHVCRESNSAVKEVSEKWILDCITQHEVLSLEEPS